MCLGNVAVRRPRNVQSTSMVALAPITNETPAWDVLDAFPKLHSRAREAKTTPCTEVPMLKSRSRIEIWLVIYETCDRLESFTRDPIGFKGSEWNLYEYVRGRSLNYIDPSGLVSVTCQCQCRQGRGEVQFTEEKEVQCVIGQACCSTACRYQVCRTGMSQAGRCGPATPYTWCFDCSSPEMCPFGQRQMFRYEAEFGGRFDDCVSANWRYYRDGVLTIAALRPCAALLPLGPEAVAACVLGLGSVGMVGICSELVCK